MSKIQRNADIDALVKQCALPDAFSWWVDDYLAPLAQRLAAYHERYYRGKTWYVGLQGTQGSGKSTVSLFLQQLIEQYPLSVTVLSLDDFYLTHKERQTLAETVHPLLQTRGVPGTHDIELAMDTLAGLSQDKETYLPRFDKAMDDRDEAPYWDKVCGPFDIVILEGWCVGLPAQDDAALTKPVNELEAQEDTDGSWRQYVNDQLKHGYADLFAMLNDLIVLQAPSFDQVFEWRLLQEKKLIEKSHKAQEDTRTLQSNESLERFIQHYQRLTEYALAILPAKARWLLSVNAFHEIIDLVEKIPSSDIQEPQENKLGGKHE
ncbi:hypothetical protein [Bermanella sp. R86510]|uniref:hypothetical protein n=1 Tax=unclassified Bermanella TaxID=2627862 RepID=UPI0037CBD433